MEFDPEEYIWCYPDEDGKWKPGVWDNTATPNEIKDHPARRWAVACGKKSGILVVDLDDITDEGMAWLEDCGITTTDTMKVRTPSGGYHWYFQYPDEGEFPRMIRPIPGIDLLGDKGVVYCIPSPDYELRTNQFIARLPRKLAESWAELATNKPQREKAQREDTLFVEEGNRDNEMYLQGVAIKKRLAGLEERDLESVLLRENAERCRPPLDSRRILELARNIIKNVETPEPLPEGQYGLPAVEVMAMDIKPLESLCGPLPAGCTIHIAGPAGVGKSFWVLHMMAAVANGATFGNALDPLGWTVPKPRSVLYIDGEMPWRFIQPRLEGMTINGVLNIVTEQWLSGHGMPPINLGEERWQEYFLKAPFDVIVFDTASSLLDVVKGGSTKDAEHWNQVVRFNTQLRSMNKSVIYVDHTSGYNSSRVEGSIAKINKTDLALIIHDERPEIEGSTKTNPLHDQDAPPQFRIQSAKNRVGALSASSKWSLHGGRFFKD